MIRVEHLRKEFSENVVPLADLSCEIDEGDVVSIIGPSGTGKSTFLNLLNRLETPTSGKIWFNGEETTAPGYDLNRLRREMGMVFQSFNLFSHQTLVENVMLGPVHLLGKGKQEAYEQAMDLLQSVGLYSRALSYPSECSGGQQQRAAIARAMAMNPKVLLFDEPTSALDPTMVSEVLAVIRNLAKSGVTMLIVTHEMNFAREVSNRIFYLDEGCVYEEGSPSVIFEHPVKEKTRRFVKNIRCYDWDSVKSGMDFPRLQGEMENFAYRCLLSPDLINRLEMLVEETLSQLFETGREIHISLHIHLEVHEKKGEIHVEIRWSGKPLNVLEGKDEYSMILLHHACPDAVYEEKDGVSVLRGIVRRKQ
ncbi:MAG: amino acid ABC transporter ATP-binding protein [Clostridia bacterium]|nr:amino acid ABC transporter ATP-binding protein [Clostridia bacterium]